MKRTKKWLVGLLACLSVFAGSLGLAACGGISGSQGLEYTLLEDGTYAVTGIGSCENTKIVIPGKYNGKAVTSIGKCAFLCRLGLNLSLTSIEIPDSVTSIDESAFAACVGLTKITVDEDNTAYKAIDGNLYNKDGKTLIQYAVGKSDTSFMIPDSVTSIGNKAFGWCDSLTSIVIPDGVASIGNSAFEDCDNLTGVVIGDSVTSIGYRAFSNCDSLTSIPIPDSVTSIGSYAFEDCESLTSVVIGDSITSINGSAFSGCLSLTSVVIGDSVTSIGNSAFYHCESLTSITFNGTIEEWNAIGKGSGWNSSVPATKVVCSDGEVSL